MSANEDLERYLEARQLGMSSEELAAPDDLLVAKLLVALSERGVDPEELDDLVYEAVLEEHVAALNELESGQEGAIATRESIASTINNAGKEAQIRALMAAYGSDGMVHSLKDVLAPSAPRP